MTWSQSGRLLVSTAMACVLAGCSIVPVPFRSEEIQNIASTNLRQVTADQEAVTGPITLYEAMARALKYNLDHKVEMLQTDLRTTELRLDHWSMLPQAVARTGFTNRNNDLSSGERNLLTGVETGPRTVSQERFDRTADIAFSWNILDFGLSYIKATQAADRVLIADEARRKVMHRIVEDVRVAYWRAVSSERMLRRLAELEGRADAAQANARKLSQSADASPVQSLTNERELIEIRRVTQELQGDLGIAKSQLAALMNFAPGTPFELSAGESSARLPDLKLNVRDMVESALHNRPELLDIAYQQRINDKDAAAALLELLPGVDIYGSDNFDSNKYLMNANWVSWGAKVSWNAMRLFQYPAKQDVIEAQGALLHERALALTMAVMTQVFVSRLRYGSSLRVYRTSGEYFDVQTRLVKQMRSEAAAERISEQTLIREELNTLVAEVKRDIAFSKVQSAYANLFTSIGRDPYYGQLVVRAGVKDLTRQIAELWFERGKFDWNSHVNVAQK